jgi:hypothetical protein
MMVELTISQVFSICIQQEWASYKIGRLQDGRPLWQLEGTLLNYLFIANFNKKSFLSAQLIERASP